MTPLNAFETAGPIGRDIAWTVTEKITHRLARHVRHGRRRAAIARLIAGHLEHYADQEHRATA